MFFSKARSAKLNTDVTILMPGTDYFGETLNKTSHTCQHHAEIAQSHTFQVKQNHVALLIFFANIRGKDTESALPLLNLIDMLTVYNIYSLHVLKFAYLWHKGLLPDVFRNTLQYASEVHSYLSLIHI